MRDRARQQCLIQAPAPSRRQARGHGNEILSLRRVAADPGLTRIDPIAKASYFKALPAFGTRDGHRISAPPDTRWLNTLQSVRQHGNAGLNPVIGGHRSPAARLMPEREGPRLRLGQDPKVVRSRSAPIPAWNIVKWDIRGTTTKEATIAHRFGYSSREQRIAGTASRQLITQRSLVQIQPPQP